MTRIGLVRGDSQAQAAADKLTGWGAGLKRVVTGAAELDHNEDAKEILFRCHGKGSAAEMQAFLS
eukprot:4628100-Pyramimonas_sp.AAC.2